MMDFDIFLDKCVRCGKPIKDPIKNYGKSDSPQVNVLCCTECIKEYIKQSKGESIDRPS